MKNPNLVQSLYCKPPQPKARRAEFSVRRLAGGAALAGLLLSANLALSEPVNLLKIPFTNAPGNNLMPSDTSLGGSNVNLTMYSAAGAASDYHGAAGSGVNGVVTGARALCLTNGAFATQPGQPFEPANATGGGTGANAAAYALDSSDAALGFGDITNFIVTMWVNQFGKMGTTTPVGPRLFILNAGAPASDTGAAGSIGVKYQANNQLYFGINASASLGATLASDLVSNKWQFFAWVYDGTNLYQYYGLDSTPAQLDSTAAIASQTVALGSSASLIIGNRTGSPAHTRGLNGWIQDFRFYNGVSPQNASLPGNRYKDRLGERRRSILYVYQLTQGVFCAEKAFLIAAIARGRYPANSSTKTTRYCARTVAANWGWLAACTISVIRRSGPPPPSRLKMTLP